MPCPRDELSDHSGTRDEKTRADDMSSGARDGATDRRITTLGRHVGRDDMRFRRAIMVVQDGLRMFLGKIFLSPASGEAPPGRGDEP